MEKLPDEILLRIFSFIHFTEQIVLHTVSRRWSFLLYDDTLLEDISITQSHCEDQQLSSLFAAAKRLPYLLVYKSTFYDQKIALDLYTSRTQRPDKAVQEINITIA